MQARYDDALRHFTRVARALPREPVVRANLGAVAVALQRYDEAIVWCDEALALAPSAKVWTVRGNALLALRRFDEAVASYRAGAGARSPLSWRPWAIMARVLRELGRFPEALAALDRALSLSPRDAELLCNRGAVLLDLSGPARRCPR